MMQDQPLVTVVMVSYNSELFIKEAIESVLCQSYQNFELVICDDASKDNTWEIIQRYNDPRIKAFRNENNIGEYPNRNKGINLSTGEYLIFIDGDDMIYPHGLEFMMKMLHAFPDCGMALMRWFKNNLFYPVVITPYQFYTGIYFGYGFNDMAFSNVLFRTKVLKEVGGLPEKYKSGDDYVRLAIATKYSSLLINDGLTWWRETPGQASSVLTNSALGLITQYNIKYKFLNDRECPLSNLEIRQAKEGMNKVVGRYIIKQLIRLRWKNARFVTKECDFSIKKFVNIFRPVKKKDPFEGYSPLMPMKLDWANNPYAKGNLI